MYDDHYDDGYFPRYISAAERKAKAAKIVAKLRQEDAAVSPVHVKSKVKIAQSFWGHAWCKNIESYRDMAYRVEMGRSYVRSGAVVDLRISEKKVSAQVSGSSLYQVKVDFMSLSQSAWKHFSEKCTGEIDSMIDLLTGKIPPKVSKLIADKVDGLFPKPSEIKFDCNCPDYADMCKHIAAVLYGIGVRFDDDPNLFFILRGVDLTDLITKASSEFTKLNSSIEDHGGLENLFGIELDHSSQDKVTTKSLFERFSQDMPVRLS